MHTPVTGIAHIMRRALNTLDYRLMDHGERVAYLLLSFYKADGTYTDAQLTEICYLGMLHDIGAYKTEHIDSLIDTTSLFHFEIRGTLSHSIYSYLFLKECEFFSEFVDAVLFHHFQYDQLLHTDCKNKQLAARIFLADRLDILILRGMVKTPKDAFTYLENPVFSAQEVKCLRQLEKDHQVLSNVINNRYLDELFAHLDTKALSDAQTHSLVKMLPYTIDFRSESTVTHTVATVRIAMTLAELFEMEAQEKNNIYYGALLHDIGKISVSLKILEKQASLSDGEFYVMQDHVLLSEYILKGQVSKEVLEIAIRHHEKLDGSGYPYGLKGCDLTLSEKIVAVADVLSALMGKRSYKDPFPEEKVIEIVTHMAQQRKLCQSIVLKAVENYSLLSQKVQAASDQTMTRYLRLEQTWTELMNKYTTFFGG